MSRGTLVVERYILPRLHPFVLPAAPKERRERFPKRIRVANTNPRRTGIHLSSRRGSGSGGNRRRNPRPSFSAPEFSRPSDQQKSLSYRSTRSSVDRSPVLIAVSLLVRGNALPPRLRTNRAVMSVFISVPKSAVRRGSRSYLDRVNLAPLLVPKVPLDESSPPYREPFSFKPTRLVFPFPWQIIALFRPSRETSASRGREACHRFRLCCASPCCARGSHRPATCWLERKSHLFRFSSRRSLREVVRSSGAPRAWVMSWVTSIVHVLRHRRALGVWPLSTERYMRV